jgi:hypothetical protein
MSTLTTLAVDPGIRGCGVAVFKADRLVHAAYVPNPVKHGYDLDAVLGMARAVVGKTESVDTVVSERMQVYAPGKGKGDPNDLIPLAAVTGAIAALTGARLTTWVLPRVWKGTLPKGAAFEARLFERLTNDERSAIQYCGSMLHNVYDAIGIGLFQAGRFDRKRVFPR